MSTAGAVRRPGDQGVDEIAVEDVVGMDLVEPLQLAGVHVERHRRVGVEVGPGTTAPVRELRGARERRRVGHAPQHQTALGVDRRRIPGTATGVHRRVAPDVLAQDGVEGPAHLAGGGVESVDHSPVAAGVDAADAHGHRAHQHQAVVDHGLDVDPRRRGGGDVTGPQLGAGGGVEGDHALRAVHPEHLAVGHGHPERADVEPVGLALPAGRAGLPVDGADASEAGLHVDGVAHDQGHRGQATLHLEPPGGGQAVHVGAVDGGAAGRTAVVVVVAGEHPVTGVVGDLHRRAGGHDRGGGRRAFLVPAAARRGHHRERGRDRHPPDPSSHESPVSGPRRERDVSPGPGVRRRPTVRSLTRFRPTRVGSVGYGFLLSQLSE